MRYYEETNKNDRLYGLIAAGVSYLLIIVLVCVLHFSFQLTLPPTETAAEGVMIDLGSDMSGYGQGMKNDLMEESAAKAQENVKEEAIANEPTINEETVKIAVAPKKKEDKQKNIEAPVKKEPTVNKKALFPGSGTDNSKGETENETGNRGSADGTLGGGNGGGNSGNGSAMVAGRSLSGALPNPTYNVNQQGRVVIEVNVNQQGVVEAAIFKAQGSTTTNNTLVNAALTAAKKAKFNVDENAPFTQTGTITYIFSLE